MTRPGETKVTVRVDVVVEGQGEPRVTAFATPPTYRAKQAFKPLAIIHPAGGGSIPVFPFGGQQCIEADGTAPTLQGSFPGRVYAKVFPDPTLDPQHASGFATPPSDAASDTPDPSDGSWSFTRGKGNPVPGATCNGSGSGNNNTLVVWYDFGSGTQDSIDFTHFYGYCVSGGFGSAPPQPTTLNATFTGALATLGTVALAYNGVSWMGVSSACGGALLAFLGNGSTYTLLAAGPGVMFAVSNTPDSPDPFSWSGSGTALGSSCSGSFDVTITE
jgi:hypothetical protein